MHKTMGVSCTGPHAPVPQNHLRCGCSDRPDLSTGLHTERCFTTRGRQHHSLALGQFGQGSSAELEAPCNVVVAQIRTTPLARSWAFAIQALRTKPPLSHLPDAE